MSEKKKLYLLDGMALAYRAHFAFINSRLKNSEGIPTGPILGFANTLVKLLEEEEPTHIAVAWDTSVPTFRHEMDQEYKANRPPQPEELKIGIPLIKEMLEYFNIQNIEQDGYEADDIIGTIAFNAQAADVNAFLITPDKDFMQLVDHHIIMVKPDNKNGGFELIDREGVKDYFGVYPEKVIDVLAIIGDASDNIPGVPGIGKVGAPKLINKYGSLEKAIEAAPGIKAKRAREGLTQFADQARHAKRMVTIKTDVPNVENWESFKWKGPDKKSLGNFFKRLEFRTLTRKYLGEEPDGQGQLFGADPDASGNSESGIQTFKNQSSTYETVVAREEIQAVVDQVRDATVFCFDTETSSADPLSARLAGISFTTKPDTAWYVPVNVEGALPEEEVLPLLQPLFTSGSLKVAHNYKFDYTILKRAGLKINGPVFDTMIAAYLIDSSQKLSMDSLSKSYLNYEPIPIEKLIGKKGKSQKSMSDLPYSEVAGYACEDADITYRLYEIFYEKLKEDGLLKIAEEVEFPLIRVLAEMEMNGVKIDIEMLREFSEKLSIDMSELQIQIFEKAGETFNLNSPQQLGKVLFDKMKLPAGKKTKTGQYSTSEQVLSQLAAEYDVPAMVLDYRSLSKLQSTYAEALPKLINVTTNRVHTDFNQAVAATGRLSSSNPNLQNIPIRTERGREIRKAFIPEDGFTMLAADYSQVELRVIASISQDENMMNAFKEGQDIHARTAKEIFSLDSLDEVTPDQRRKAKEVNFGIPYGVSAYGLASRLGISNKDGGEMIDHYFERFPGVRTYINETIEFAREHGYVSTLLGRRRYIPDIHSGNWNMRSFAERTAINMPIQGTAADIIKLAMIHIQEFLEKENLASRMLMQVHDELVFEISNDELDEIPGKIKELMESAFELKVPLIVETGTADNWLDAH